MILFHHYAIETSNLAKVLHFYQTVLGFHTEETFYFQGNKIVFLTLGSFRIELAESDEESNGDGPVHLCFETDGLDNIMEELDQADLTRVEGPYKLENGWRTVFYTGPAGELLEFLAMG
ncbi:VOC family protein [Bacillus sp. FJAT-27445]|uniref:VOC family protein n=1 Tax=Bacillus sp. FJAT-27445 TaxID=1679166 RepID=UPI0007435FF6|nr:VOC family protein [Bacillus sp. FJAT-27445]